MRKYLVIYERGPRNYAAYDPDLPGCVSTGKTLKDAERNMREALLLHLEGFTTPPPRPACIAGTLSV